ncbi:MAG: ATP-dependent zinc metalloprotease FtsH [Chitinophagales bacterium]|nr:ATP-dependent zinc metalloprotease FtsH [Chitinophagales bacterium]
MDQNRNQENNENVKPPKFNYYWIYGLLAIVFLFSILSSFLTNTAVKTYQTTFMTEMLTGHDVEKVVVVTRSANDKRVEVYLKESAISNQKYKEDLGKSRFGANGPHYYFNISSADEFKKDLEEAQSEMSPDQHIVVDYLQRRNWTKDLMGWIIPFAIIILLWIFIMRRVSGGMGGAGGQIFNIGKSKATLFDRENTTSLSFNDVAGLDEAKEEVMEIVDFLKSPKKYTRLGGKIPKGALLIGPPGTGKTLLAKAMAGEAGVPFFSISGSDFVEMFVGVGASRVRDLFKQAREKAPCIIFIDEIDAIGRARGKNMLTGNDERENTLNQLLVEMDGFSSEKGVIILAATNRPDVLDSALLRPGRFDRQISIDKPDLQGREQIFKVHLNTIKLADEVDAYKLAAQTPGFVGADIANICNEAALIAARKNKSSVDMDDFNDAIDRSIGGLEKKHKIISPEERRVIAYHEAGHAICGWFLKNAHPLVKVSIIPRGVAALGYAQYLPKEKYIETTDEMLDRMCMTLGGRAAEEITFSEISTGAQNDLDMVTKMAYAIVTIFGMNEKVGNVSYYELMNQNNFHKPYSEATARIIDEEIRAIIVKQFVRAKELLKTKNKELNLLANELLEKEVLFKDDLVRLIGARPWDNDGKENEETKDESVIDLKKEEEDSNHTEKTDKDGVHKEEGKNLREA